MRDIPRTYNKDGFTHTLVARHPGVAAIYEQRKGDFVRYEVVILRQRTQDYEARQVKKGDWYLPTTNEWGRYGWTYQTYEAANEKMSKIILEKNKKTW